MGNAVIKLADNKEKPKPKKVSWQPDETQICHVELSQDPEKKDGK